MDKHINSNTQISYTRATKYEILDSKYEVVLRSVTSSSEELSVLRGGVPAGGNDQQKVDNSDESESYQCHHQPQDHHPEVWDLR